MLVRHADRLAFSAAWYYCAENIIPGVSAIASKKSFTSLGTLGANASDTWHSFEILQQVIDLCWDQTATTFATILAHVYFNKLHNEASSLCVSILAAA